MVIYGYRIYVTKKKSFGKMQAASTPSIPKARDAKFRTVWFGGAAAVEPVPQKLRSGHAHPEHRQRNPFRAFPHKN